MAGSARTVTARRGVPHTTMTTSQCDHGSKPGGDIDSQGIGETLEFSLQ